MEVEIDINESPYPGSPVVPTQYDGSKVIQFQCRKGITCWNACCSNIDIILSPYDILRMKRRLGMTSGEFLLKYTYPFEFEKEGIAGVKFQPVGNGTACQFMRPEGCDIYEDRPTACRYYPVALLSMRKQDEFTDCWSYALVEEKHCLGHQEPRSLSIDDYRKEQGLEEYDELARGWRQLILKKKSSGPTVGKPSKRSLQLFFMACYDIDRFREFVKSDSFNEIYDLPADLKETILGDEIELMKFGFRFLRQVMFGEDEGIAMHSDALDKRLARKREIEEERAEMEKGDENSQQP